MDSQRIYRRKTMRLDNRVWLVMIGLVVLLEGFYLYKIIRPTKCTSFAFTIKNSAASLDTSLFVQGDYLFFDAVPADQNIVWDFGDNTKSLQGTPVSHQFNTPGRFTIKAKLGSCEYEVRQLTIRPTEAPKLKVFTIIADDSIEVGKPASFYCPDSAARYDWSVKDYPEVTASGTGQGNMHQFVFPLANLLYTVECRLDNDKNKIAIHYIYVKPKPAPVIPQGPKSSVGDVCNQPVDGPKFQALLTEGLYGSFPPGNFSQFLCNGDQTPVVVNGKPMTFGEFIIKLSAIKPEAKFDKRRDNAQRMRINVTIVRADQTIRGESVKGVVQSLNIRLEQSLSNLKGKNVTWKEFSLH